MRFKVPDAWFTYFAAISVNLLSYGGGLGYGWSSPALPKLSGQLGPEQNPLSRPATVQEESWIASLLSLGAMISPIFTEILCERVGRKKTLLLFSLPMIVGYVIMIFANKVVHFYVARFLMGLTEGCLFATIPVYSAEISQNHNRGIIGAIMLLFVSIGHFTSSTIGPTVTISTFSIISLVPCLLFLLVFGLFVPESPYYFVLKGNEVEAEQSLRKLRGKQEVEEELGAIIKSVVEMKSLKGKSALRELFTSSGKTFCWALALMMFQQFTGLIYIVDYTQKIFDSAQTPISGDVSVMLVTTVQVISILFSTNIIDKVARKVLLLLSLVIILVLQVLLGAFFYLQAHQVDLHLISWLPIACLMIFIMAFQLGIGPISYIFPGEIFEPNVKSLGNMLVICIGLLGEFSIATFLPLLSDWVGFYVPFWIFASSTCAAIIFVWTCLPETGGKSFLEIQENVRNRVG